MQRLLILYGERNYLLGLFVVNFLQILGFIRLLGLLLGIQLLGLGMILLFLLLMVQMSQ